MPKIVYANVIWLLLMWAGFVNASLVRHQSSTWIDMPEALANYDLLFVGLFGVLFLASIVGLFMQKKWGYELAMASNYLIAFLFLLPFVMSLILRFRYDIPYAEFPDSYWNTTPPFLVGFAISMAIIVVMNGKYVKSVFSNKR